MKTQYSFKQILTFLVMFLIVSTPVTSYSMSDSIEGSEDFAVQVLEYQPTVLPAALIEQQQVPVYAKLAAIGTNPFSQNIKIRDVRIEILTQEDVRRDEQKEERNEEESSEVKSEEDEDFIEKYSSDLEGTDREILKNYIQGNPKYRRPLKGATWDDLGLIEINLKQIPKEADVPDEIKLDLKATIRYEAEVVGDILGKSTINLGEMPEEDFLRTKISKTLGEYEVYVPWIQEDSARICLWDGDLDKKLDCKTIYESQSKQFRRTSVYSGENPYFRMRVDDIFIPDNEDGVRAYFEIDGALSSGPLKVGEEIPATSCTISNIKFDANKIVVSDGSNSASLDVGDTLGDWDVKLQSGSVPNCGNNQNLKLVRLEKGKTVTITYLEGLGTGYTETEFSVHLPIEKRPIELTPERIERELNKTKRYIEKLDNYIEKLEGTTEKWQNVCLATAATFTVAQFFSGAFGSGGEETSEGGTAPGKSEGGSGSDNNYRTIELPSSCLNNMYGFKFVDKKMVSSPFEGGKIYPGTSNIYKKGVSARGDDTGFDYTQYFYCDLDNDNSFSDGDEVYKIEKDGSMVSLGTKGDYEQKSSLKQEKDLIFDGEDMIIPIRNRGELPTESLREKFDDWTNLRFRSNICVHYNSITDTFRFLIPGEDGLCYNAIVGEKEVYRLSYSTDKTLQMEYQQMKNWVDSVERSFEKGKTSLSGFLKGGTGWDLINKQISFPSESEQTCENVAGEGWCKLLYNACDPVMCPPSRCDLDGNYRVENVIASGLIGSLSLCLPNIEKGVIMPVCLTGVLASLKNIQTVLQGYQDCLIAARDDGESIGVCDEIRSVWLCEILWNEVYTFFKLKGGIVSWLFNSLTGKGGSGGEYISEGAASGVESAGEFLNFFTKDYATSVFASYKGRTSKEVGQNICQSAIYGKAPWFGEFFEEISTPENPIQYTAYVQEHPFSNLFGYSGIRKQQSRYQLYYHIYAGDEDVYYNIYLKKDGAKIKGTNYQKGSLKKGEFVDKTINFIDESGMQEVCIELREGLTGDYKTECGFGKTVSTSFGVDKINEYVLNYQMSNSVTTTKACLREGVGDSLYGYTPGGSMLRVCSLNNPGIGLNQESLWTETGTCDEGEGNCWTKFGDLQDYPEQYLSSFKSLCASDGGYVCDLSKGCASNALGIREFGDVVYNYDQSKICCRPLVSGTKLDENLCGISVKTSVPSVDINNVNEGSIGIDEPAVTASAGQNNVPSIDIEIPDEKICNLENYHDSVYPYSIFVSELFDLTKEEYAACELSYPREGEINYIVLHHTGTDTLPSDILTDWFNRVSPNRVSAHYIVGEDGIVVSVVPEERAAWHAGCKSTDGYCKIVGMNHNSIGIEIINLGEDNDPYEADQIIAVKDLVNYLIAKYGLDPETSIVGHGCVTRNKMMREPVDFPTQLVDWNLNYPESKDDTCGINIT